MLARIYTSKEIQNILKKHNDELNTCYTICYRQNEPYFHLQEFRGGNWQNKKLTQEESKELLLKDFFYQIIPKYWHLYCDHVCGHYILVWEM